MKERLNSMLKSYTSQILLANSANQCYFDMRYRTERNEHWEDVYKISPAFFGLARRGLQTEAYLTISKLYEPNGRSDYNLYKLLNFVSGNSKNIVGDDYKDFNKQITELRNRLDELQPIANKLLYFRDKVIVHNGNEHFLEPSDEKSYPDGLTFEESLELLKVAGQIVNELSSAVFNYTTHLKYTNGYHNNGHDIDSLMNFCLKHLNC